MSTVAIVSEYNPFHNGHKYHLEQALKLSGADHSIAIMSGNFLQRGIPALTNKYHRAYMSTLSGVDMVFELPFVYATASARDFATAAVIMMNKLSVVDYIAFGVETDDLEAICFIANLIQNEPKEIGRQILMYLSSGMSYPASRLAAYKKYLNSDILADILSNPNNILATEYLAALLKTDSDIKPIAVKRNASEYNSTNIDSSICSATAIRQQFIENEGSAKMPANVEKVVPEQVFSSMNKEYHESFPVFDDDLSAALAYSRIIDDNNSEFVDMNNDLINRMNKVNLQTSFSELAASLKTKNITLSHINRALLHYIFRLNQEAYNSFKDNGYIYYAKLLSLRKEASHILKCINDNADIPVINKTADGVKLLDSTGYDMFRYDNMATTLYNQLVYEKYGTILPNDYTRSISII